MSYRSFLTCTDPEFENLTVEASAKYNRLTAGSVVNRDSREKQRMQESRKEAATSPCKLHLWMLSIIMVEHNPSLYASL